MIGFEKEKGVSPLIASVLLIGITLTVMLTFSDFVPGLIQDVTNSTSQDADRVVDSTSYLMEVESAEQNLVKDEVKVLVRNQGASFTSNVSVTVYCPNDAHQKQVGSFDQGEIQEITIEDVDCNVERTSISLNDYPVSTDSDRVEKTGKVTLVLTPSDLRNIEFASSNLLSGSFKLDYYSSDTSETMSFTGDQRNMNVSDGELKLQRYTP